jgi:hypothetical protein
MTPSLFELPFDVSLLPTLGAGVLLAVMVWFVAPSWWELRRDARAEERRARLANIDVEHWSSRRAA